MTDPALTDHIIAQDKALVRAIEALSTIQPSGPFERALARLGEVQRPRQAVDDHARRARPGS